MILLVVDIDVVRRLVTFCIRYTVGLNLKVNEYKLYPFPIAILSSVWLMAVYYMETDQRAGQYEERKVKGDMKTELAYLKQLYEGYRNMLVHFSHVVMGTLLFFSAKKYQDYCQDLEECEKLESELKAAGIE